MLTRFDPFRDIDRLVEQLSAPRAAARTPGMPLDIARNNDGYVVQADLPGANPGSIDISVEGNVLTIRAERATSKVDDMELLASERATGSYVRQLTVGEGFDLERVEASYVGGVLTVTLPVAERAKPRRIQINVNGETEAKEVETASSSTT